MEYYKQEVLPHFIIDVIVAIPSLISLNLNLAYNSHMILRYGTTQEVERVIHYSTDRWFDSQLLQ